ncbi:MAG: cytochrome c biogenesis protein CcsA [Bacteroidales bacterium]|nr:cytochrome c biogenesis protein CcsA [Bacteroidales bacterium]
MKKISNFLFSLSSMGVLLLLFAAAMAVATFVENDFGTAAAKALVYNALWFDLLLALLAANLVANVFREKMYRKGRLSMLLFHLAFLVILLGAAVTRFISFEGMMHIRNGETSNSILSDRTYVELKATDGKQEVSNEKSVLLSTLTPTDYSDKVHMGDKKVTLKAVQYIPNARKQIIPDASGEAIVALNTISADGRRNLEIGAGDVETVGSYEIQFGGVVNQKAINLFVQDGQLMIMAPDTLRQLSMHTRTSKKLAPGEAYEFKQGVLYMVGKLNLILTNYYPHAKVVYTSSRQSNNNVLMVEARSGNESKKVALSGGEGMLGEKVRFSINGVHLMMSYGARKIQLPFSVKLDRFELDRYPGSMSPSSYASWVTVIDPKSKKEMPFHIYMNHVLNYKGYRFFQSSYDRDEKGSVLSVNHDYWGTFFTYLGYFLMALGMALSLLNRNSRFAVLGRYLKKTSAVTKMATVVIFAVVMTGSHSLFAQHSHMSLNNIPKVNKEEAAKFGRLMVQSEDGRMKPVSTLSSKLLRKLAWKNSLNGLNPDQVVLGMMSSPFYWQLVPIIKVGNPDLAKKLGIQGKYAAYIDFIDIQTGQYKLQKAVSRVYEKKPSERDMEDKEVVKVDERMNIAYMIFKGSLLRIFPDTRESVHKWYAPDTPLTGLSAQDTTMIAQVFPAYLKAIGKGNRSLSNSLIEQMSAFQTKYGAAVMPSEPKINAEILYNRWMIFDRLGMVYGAIGFFMIILLFLDLLRGSKFMKVILKVFFWIIVVAFVVQTFGLGLRWYISGHAPWSDGYETMLYISWVTILAGLLFSKRSMMTVAATTILSAIFLMVAHLSWMDPEITNLVPVLKSYWLTIHVSVITASYGFLALSALLGFFNLVLGILKSPKNKEVISQRITELTVINERSLIIGLYMLTIGTFLGGIWANESWGRYWGWDPKETWALVSVVVYSFIAHMHVIPGLKSKYSFNLASLLGYAVILMTFFGVNYYLSGLHSYAKGDPVPVPAFVYWAVAVVFIVAVWAFWNEQKFKSAPVVESKE